MGDFNKGKKFGGGGRSFSGGNRGENRGSGNRRDGVRPQMHRATCSDCGNSCEVPFRPTGDKPIFCNDCFKNKGGDSSRDFRGGGNRDFDRNRRSSQPRFGDNRSDQNNGGRNTENYKIQFEQLNTKLDKILRILTSDISEETRGIKVPKSKKLQKAPKKTNAAALKNVITKTMDKKLTAEEAENKKPSAKKSSPTKKVAVKKKKK